MKSSQELPPKYSNGCLSTGCLMDVLKYFIGIFASGSILFLSGALILLFFSEEGSFLQLIAAFVLPLITMILSSQYCMSSILGFLLAFVGIAGFFELQSPFNYITGVFALDYFLFKIVRVAFNYTGDYLNRDRI